MGSRFITTIILAAVSLGLAGQGLALEEVYGKGVSATDTILVSRLLAHPDQYVGQVVRVQGTAVGVCQHRGCWVAIASDRETETVRVKVKDGQIVFPPEIVGEQVIAEGVFTANKLDLETTKKMCAHRAEQAGEDFDPEKVTECLTLYQITGTGAVVLEDGNDEHPGQTHEHDAGHGGL